MFSLPNPSHHSNHGAHLWWHFCDGVSVLFSLPEQAVGLQFLLVCVISSNA